MKHLPLLPLTACLLAYGCGQRPTPVVSPAHVYHEASIDDIVAAGADGSVEQARKQYGIALDYKPRSIKQVDRILAKLHGEYIKDKSNHRWTMECLGWGAYVGEVIRRQYGGHWSQTDPATGNPLPLVWRNGTAYPVVWCLGELVNGPSDSVWLKYEVITSPEYSQAYAKSGKK